MMTELEANKSTPGYPSVQVLVSTMHRSNADFLDEMNVDCDAVVVNQTNHLRQEQLQSRVGEVLFNSTTDRGLSRSRNLALSLADADVCVLADDDVRYHAGLSDRVAAAHRALPEVAIVAFRVDRLGSSRRKQFARRPKRVGYLRAMRISSVEVTFKRAAVVGAELRFDERFGAGAIHPMGEESIFLFDALRSGLRIAFLPECIGETDVSTSTWFRGFDTAYFAGKGAAFERMSSMMSLALILQFAVRKRRHFSGDLSILRVLRAMLGGRKVIRRSRTLRP